MSLLGYVITIFVVICSAAIICYAPVKIIVEGLLCITLLLAVYLVVDIIYLWKKKEKR